MRRGLRRIMVAGLGGIAGLGGCAARTVPSATTQAAAGSDFERARRIDAGTTRPITPEMRANDAALRDAVLADVLANRASRDLDFYGTPGSREVVLFGEAADATLPEGWIRVEPVADKSARAKGNRQLALSMTLSSYVLGDGETRVVGVDVFNVGGSANGGVIGFTKIAYHATPTGTGWTVRLAMMVS